MLFAAGSGPGALRLAPAPRHEFTCALPLFCSRPWGQRKVWALWPRFCRFGARGCRCRAQPGQLRRWRLACYRFCRRPPFAAASLALMLALGFRSCLGARRRTPACALVCQIAALGALRRGGFHHLAIRRAARIAFAAGGVCRLSGGGLLVMAGALSAASLFFAAGLVGAGASLTIGYRTSARWAAARRHRPGADAPLGVRQDLAQQLGGERPRSTAARAGLDAASSSRCWTRCRPKAGAAGAAAGTAACRIHHANRRRRWIFAGRAARQAAFAMLAICREFGSPMGLMTGGQRKGRAALTGYRFLKRGGALSPTKGPENLAGDGGCADTALQKEPVRMLASSWAQSTKICA